MPTTPRYVLDRVAQPRAGQAVQAPVVGQVLARGQLLVQAGRLRQDAGDGPDAGPIPRPADGRSRWPGHRWARSGRPACGWWWSCPRRWARAARRSPRPQPRTTGRARRSAAGSPCEGGRRTITGGILAGHAAPSPIGTFGCRGRIGPMEERTTASTRPFSRQADLRPRRRGRAGQRPRGHARGRGASGRGGDPGLGRRTPGDGQPVAARHRARDARDPCRHAGSGRVAARHGRA